MEHRERHVRLFRNGRTQALRIPREFELQGDEAIVRKEGERLVVGPVRKGRLLALLSTMEPLDEALPDMDEDLPRLDDVTFQSRYLNLQVRGKGRKHRLLTLWKAVAESTRAWLAVRSEAPVPELS